MTPSDQSPADQLRSSVDLLKLEIDSLRGKVTLADMRDQVADLHNGTLGLGQRLKDLRVRSYDFEKSLETKAADMEMRWATIRGTVDSQLIQQSTMLQNDMRSIDAQLPQLMAVSTNVALALPQFTALKTGVDALKGRTTAAADAIHNLFSAYQDEYNKLDRHLDEVTWALDRRDEATFQMLATEGIVMAVNATWARNGKENDKDPKGVIYLTDQRLLFEQKQEVATKKILFITTASEMVHKLLFATPVALVEEVTASKQGFFKNQDFIDMRLATGAPFPTATFHLDGQDSSVWANLIRRAKGHDLDADRAVAIDQVETDKIKAAPVKCPSCGGAINQPILRGQDVLNCEFCGVAIRL